MYGLIATPNGGFNLQATLSASSASSSEQPKPHHPITCPSTLRFEADNTFSCEHVSVDAEDQRTQFCLNHSIALLLIEVARERLG